jgi:predicted DNA-binding protein YlxM (UPF0122 family)
MLEKVARMNLLYDFYGQLLTGRQRNSIEFYYGQNLSLGEIATELSVSRQAVHDTLKRAENLLVGYEEKLGLAERFLEQKNLLQETDELLEQYRCTGEPGKFTVARRIIKDLLET